MLYICFVINNILDDVQKTLVFSFPSSVLRKGLQNNKEMPGNISRSLGPLLHQNTRLLMLMFGSHWLCSLKRCCLVIVHPPSVRAWTLPQLHDCHSQCTSSVFARWWTWGLCENVDQDMDMETELSSGELCWAPVSSAACDCTTCHHLSKQTLNFFFFSDPGHLEAAEPFDCTQNKLLSHFYEDILDPN